MMVLDESMVDDHPRQQPPRSDSRARAGRPTLMDCARFVLAKSKLLVSIGGTAFLSALEAPEEGDSGDPMAGCLSRHCHVQALRTAF